ncbi:hypothetical protein STA3757_08240 [Stanieria sp. NIES-3757]|nr:hypothetical protein STA3757_08240 [Stanieria sp. NIES-3757]
MGISFNLYELSQTINQNATDVNNLISQLQKPLQNMGIAFITSLAAIACSSLLIVVNLRYNTNFAKTLLISSLEDYLDNIFKIEIDGYSRLDKAVDRIVKQQQEFLTRFHEKVGQVLETTIGDAANKMVAANQGFQNNVDSMVSRFNDISSSMAVSTDSFQESAFSLKEQIQTVTNIVPKFESSANKIESSSKLYLLGAKKIEESKFSENLETLTQDLANTQKSFSISTKSLGNHVEQLIVNHNHISSSLAVSSDSFKESAFSLKEQIQTVTNIVPKFETLANKIEFGSKLYLQGAKKIEASKFSENLENLTQDLANTQKSFSQSTAFLGDQVHKITEIHQQAVQLAEQVYTQLQTASNKLQDSSIGFMDAAETFQQSDFADKLNTATQKLITIPKQFNESTAILHQSTDALGKAIDNIYVSTQETNNLIQKVNNLNEHSAKLLETSECNIQREVESFNKIKSELERIATTLDKHKEQINLSIASFGEKILKSFEQQTSNNVIELQKIATEINNQSNSLKNTQTETSKLIAVLENYINHFNSINSQLAQLITNSEQQGKQINSSLSGIGSMSDRLLNSFEQRSQNNTQEITKLIEEFKQIINQLNTIPTEIGKVIGAIKQHEKQINSDLNELGNNITNQANQQIQNMTEKFNKFF